MKKLYVFNENIKLNWIDIYLGLRYCWITSNEVLEFVEERHVQCASIETYGELYWALDDSLYEFGNVLSSYIAKEYNFTKTLLLDQPDLEWLPLIISQNHWKKWELNFLLEIKFSEKSISEKIYDIYLLWCDFKYFQVDWHSFLWISNIESSTEIELYNNFLHYVEKLRIDIKTR